MSSIYRCWSQLRITLLDWLIGLSGQEPSSVGARSSRLRLRSRAINNAARLSAYRRPPFREHKRQADGGREDAADDAQRNSDRKVPVPLCVQPGHLQPHKNQDRREAVMQ